jgi:hypothetical protein
MRHHGLGLSRSPTLGSKAIPKATFSGNACIVEKPLRNGGIQQDGSTVSFHSGKYMCLSCSHCRAWFLVFDNADATYRAGSRG